MKDLREFTRRFFGHGDSSEKHLCSDSTDHLNTVSSPTSSRNCSKEYDKRLQWPVRSSSHLASSTNINTTRGLPTTSPPPTPDTKSSRSQRSRSGSRRPSTSYSLFPSIDERSCPPSDKTRRSRSMGPRHGHPGAEAKAFELGDSDAIPKIPKSRPDTAVSTTSGETHPDPDWEGKNILMV